MLCFLSARQVGEMEAGKVQALWLLEQDDTFLSLLMHMGWSSWCPQERRNRAGSWRKDIGFLLSPSPGCKFTREFKRRIECKLILHISFSGISNITGPCFVSEEWHKHSQDIRWVFPLVSLYIYMIELNTPHWILSLSCGWAVSPPINFFEKNYWHYFQRECQRMSSGYTEPMLRLKDKSHPWLAHSFLPWVWHRSLAGYLTVFQCSNASLLEASLFPLMKQD